MKKNKHLIEKVLLEINTNSMKVANSLKNNINMFIEAELLMLIEQELDRFWFDENQILQIDKLEISIDNTIFQNGSTIINNALKEDIKKQLFQKLEFTKNQSNTAVINNARTNQIISQTEKRSNTLIYYLTNGIMPWWCTKNKDVVFNDQNMDSFINSETFKHQFQSILNKTIVQKRLINQFSNKQLALIISILTTDKVSLQDNKIIYNLHQGNNFQLKEFFWISTFKYIIDKNPNTIINFYFKNIEKFKIWNLSFEEFIINIKQFVPFHNDQIDFTSAKNDYFNEKKSDDKKLDSSVSGSEQAYIDAGEIINPKASVNKNPANLELENEKQKQQQKQEPENECFNKKKSDDKKVDSPVLGSEPANINADKIVNPKKSVNKKPADSELENEKQEQKQNQEQEKNQEQKQEQHKKQERKLEQEIEERDNSNFKNAFYIQNAGLIIIHPFIKELFKNCNLITDDNTLIDKELAAHILHYAATKKEHDYEHSMLFEKFLCGIPIRQSIQREINITDFHKEQVDEMLQSAIKHWNALKSTSIDLLRNEFLQRDGKLDIQDNNPRIFIEKKTQDILLEKIPWNISIVKIPWIEKLIYTEW